MTNLKVLSMIPFHAKVQGNQVIITFAFKYIELINGNKIYFFTPYEDRSIVFNLEHKVVENSLDIFVFQSGLDFVRIPLYELMLKVEGFADHVFEIARKYKSNPPNERGEIDLLFQELETMHIKHAMDLALEQRDFITCRKLVELCNTTNMESEW